MGKLHFFIVDDDADDVILFKTITSRIDPSITVSEAVDGKDAVEKIGTLNPAPDLLFLDLNMPRMDGKQVLSYIKQDPDLKNIPVIIYTTSSLAADIQDTLIGGAAGFVSKPNSPKELQYVIETLVHHLPRNLKQGLDQLSNRTGLFVVH